MIKNLFTKKTEADKQMEALIKKMKMERRAFENKTGKFIRKIENDIEIEKHLQKVTDHELSHILAQGLQKISDAAEGIVFPEDIA